MNRDQMIERLIDNDIDLIRQGATHSDFEYVAGVLRDGCAGYRNYTDEELLNETLERFPMSAYNTYNLCQEMLRRLPDGEMRDSLLKYMVENFA